MIETFDAMLAEEARKNSLGRVNEVIDDVLADPSRLEELYMTMFNNDAWVRMRAADAFEKVCRVNPEWVKTYVDRIQSELSSSTQASIQWHIAQIYAQVDLNARQKKLAILWLTDLLHSTDVDWIVASNAMETLAAFTRNGEFPIGEMLALAKMQQNHKSNAVVKRANKLYAELTSLTET